MLIEVERVLVPYLVDVGVAWPGLLANFAAGAFPIVLRPFKAGDMITAGGGAAGWPVPVPHQVMHTKPM